MNKYKVIHVTHPTFGGENVPLIVKAKRLKGGPGKTLKLSNQELGMNLKNFPEIHGGWILPALALAPTIIGGIKSLFGRGIDGEEATDLGAGFFDDFLNGASRVANIAATVAPLFGRGLVSKRSEFAGGRIYNSGGRIKLALGEGIEGHPTSCSLAPPDGKKLMVFPLIEKTNGGSVKPLEFSYMGPTLDAVGKVISVINAARGQGVDAPN